MDIEIISIGDELLIGQTVNSNAAWMGEQLLSIGAEVTWITTVGDRVEYIEQALRIAETRAQIVLVTGGLGPTHDDITKKVICQYFKSKLVLNESVLAAIKERLQRRGIPLSESNRQQALVPENAGVIPNEIGTAPGLKFSRNGKVIYVMPGVPREMQLMMVNYILPEISSMLNGQVVKKKILFTTGIAESVLFEKLGDIEAIEQYASIAFLPGLDGVKIRLLVKAKSESEAEERLQKAERLVRQNIEPYIYADDDVLIEKVIGDLLTEKKRTVAVAESCTGGLIANRLTNVSGSSLYFERGVVSYSNQAKIDLLGVPADLIEKYGAVSAEVAKAMAKGVRERANTNYGISTTGIAGPTGGSKEKPVGLVFIGYSDKNKTIYERHIFTRDRLANKYRFSQAALNLLRREILKDNG